MRGARVDAIAVAVASLRHEAQEPPRHALRRQGERRLHRGPGDPRPPPEAVRGGDQVPAQGGPRADQEDGRLHAGVQQAQSIQLT